MTNSSTTKIIAVVAVIAVLIVAIALVVSNPGQNSDSGVSSEGIECLDMSDNKVIMPKDVDSMYLIGVGSLRVISHLGLADKVCGADQLSKGATYGSNTYMYAFDELFNDESVISHSGARQEVNLERLMTCNNGEKPDVIVIVDTVAADNRSTLNSLAKAGIVIFEIQSVQELMGDNYQISPLYEKQLTRLGIAFQVEERANELINGVNSIMNDVRSMCSGPEQKAYIGGLTVAQARGLNLTCIDYTPFLLAGTSNIIQEGNPALDAGGTAAGVSVEVQGLLKTIENSGDFKMFVDPAGWRLQNGLCTGDNLVSAALANSGITEGVVVTPFHSYGMEYDNILVNCYLVAGSLYNLDENLIREKIDGVYELYYGDNAVNSEGVKLYDEMGEWYYDHTHCHFGESVKFSVDGITMTDGTVLTFS